MQKEKKERVNKIKGYDGLIYQNQELYEDFCIICNKKITFLDVYYFVEKLTKYDDHIGKTFHYAHGKCIG